MHDLACIYIPVFCHNSLLYLIGTLCLFSNSNVVSWKKYYKYINHYNYCAHAVIDKRQQSMVKRTTMHYCLKHAMLTIVNSFPCAFLKAFVHLTLRGLRFLLNALWHFERQNLNVCVWVQITSWKYIDVSHLFTLRRISTSQYLCTSVYVLYACLCT